LGIGDWGLAKSPNPKPQSPKKDLSINFLNLIHKNF
jgi:hypothetical protein